MNDPLLEKREKREKMTMKSPKAQAETTDNSSLPAAIQEDWVMKAKPTSSWKFLLGANIFKGYQLDFVEKKGETITVAVQSGKKCSFKIGEFKGRYFKT